MQSELAASNSSTTEPTLAFAFVFFFFTAVNLNFRPQAVSALNSTHPSSLLAFLLAVDVSCRGFRKS